MSNSSNVISLADLQGLASAKRFLERLFAAADSPHALLLYGGRGSGKTTLAQALSQFWLCKNPLASGACGACQPCRAFGAGENPDHLTIAPFGPSRWITLPFFIEVESRPKDLPPLPPMLTFLRTMPLLSRSKVVLIEDADRMNFAAANTLLKTLEEPDPYVKVILTTRFISQLPATILSRCVALSCEIPSGMAYGESVGDRLWADRHAELQSEIEAIAEQVRSDGRAALLLSDRMRVIAERLADRQGIPAREANCQALELLAAALARRGMSEQARAAIEAHRRVAGNGSLGLNLDAIFTGFSVRD